MAERKNVALLMTDVVGSTRLEQRYGALFLHWLQQHVELAAQLATECGGKVLKHRGEGDSIFAAFDHPQQAVDCAVRCQRAFREISFEGDVVRVRMAVDFGEAYSLESDFWGGLVNRCARLREVSHGGQILATGAAVGQSGLTGFQLLGTHHLRDVEEPLAIFQVVAEGLDHEFPPISTVTTKTNLPSYASAYIGREEERASVRKLLLNHPLITLSGPGGSGKTRFAVEIASRSLSHYSDGVIFVDLLPVDSPEGAWQTIASHLDPTARVASPDALTGLVAGKRLLLVLDNAEHLVEPVRKAVQAMLAGSTDIRLLVTSQEPLGLPNERRVPLGGLGEYGIRLLIARAEAAGVDQLASSSSTDVLQQLVDSVDGLAVGIELLAPMLSAMSPESVLALLREQGALLLEGETETRTYRNLEAMLEWSLMRLPEEDRAALFALGLFRGSFGLAAAAAVWGQNAWQAAQRIKRFVDRSLVWFEPRPGGEDRYRLPQTTIAFIESRGVSPEHVERFVSYAADRSEELDQRLRAEQSTEAFRAWDDSSQTVQHALSLAVQQRHVEPAMRIVQAGTLYWGWRPSFGDVTRHAEALAPHIPAEPSEIRARYLNSLAVILIRGNRPHDAKPFALAALEDARERGDRAHQAKVLLNLAVVAQLDGSGDDPIPMATEAAEIFRELRDLSNLGVTLGNLGVMLNQEGTVDRAVELLNESVRVFTEAGDRARLVLTLQNLAETHLKRGAHSEALDSVLSSVQLVDAIQLQGTLAQAAQIAAVTLVRMGRPDLGVRLWRHADGIAESEVIVRNDELEEAYASEIATLRRDREPIDDLLPTIAAELEAAISMIRVPELTSSGETV